MIEGQSIAIIGAGIGGLAAALALRLRGADVKVFEQAEALGEVGAGLQISPNGAAVFKALGVAPQVRTLSLRAKAVDLCDYRQGRLVCRLDLARYVPALAYSIVHRADLVGDRSSTTEPRRTVHDAVLPNRSARHANER